MDLDAFPSLQHLTPEQLRELRDSCAERSLDAGEELIRYGDEGGKLYFLIEGRVEVYMAGRGPVVVLAELSAPAIVGELEMLTGEKRSASVRAAVSSRVLSLAHDDVERRIEAGDATVLKAMYGIGRVIAARLVAMSAKFADLEAHADAAGSRELREFRKKLFSDWSL
ncbi:MAG: cyclic nucleotide-binding domain-containing protein [Myxococcota bacterium]|nr:cyclic nucleotide-binding domain-containing protein [Myxococcota bacterium]